MLTGGAHKLRLGRPEEIPYLARQTRLTFARCGIVDPLSLDDYRAHGGLKGLARAIEIGPAATIETVTQSGLRGRGGAGFPPGSNGRPRPTRRASASSSSAMPMKAIPARSPIGC